MAPPEKQKEHPRLRDLPVREMLALADDTSYGMKVIPGKTWSFHYPVPEAERQEKLQALLEGRAQPAAVSAALKPDAVMFSIDDVREHGFAYVSDRLRDMTSRVIHHDYDRFASFVASMKGRGADLETISALYDGIRGSRVRKMSLDTYGSTGRGQMQRTLEREASSALAHMGALPRASKVLEALKLDWLAEDQRLLESNQRDAMLAGLSGDERALFQELHHEYRRYVEQGQEDAYAALVEKMAEAMPIVAQHQPPGEGPSESMKELEKTLEPFMEQAQGPGTEQDFTIPPDDRDEIGTPQPKQPGEALEKGEPRVFFVITPSGTSTIPLGGHYCSGIKSYYDIDKKEWSKRKQLTPYHTQLSGEKRQTISGNIDSGLKSIPLPQHYALDASSLRCEGSAIQLSRDQNGCFYVQASGPSSFSVDFLEENPPFSMMPPIPEDTAPLYRGKLSGQTETAIPRLHGDVKQKALQAKQYIAANHFYPGGGDLKKAEALQRKLLTESNGDNYVQNLDASEYLECRSAATLWVAIMRKAGVPARLIVGHDIDTAHDGKAVIDENTGHAWGAYWDGSDWVRTDPTPPPKPEDKEDKKKDEGGEQGGSSPVEQANDGGLEDSPAQSQGEGQAREQERQQGQPQPGDLPGEVQDRVDEQAEAMESASEASDSEMADANEQLDQAREDMKQAEQKKSDLQQKISEADSFKDAADLKEEIEGDEAMLDDMKKELEEKLEAKEEGMKDALKDELREMSDDGFIDEAKANELEEKMKAADAAALDNLMKEIEEHKNLHDKYEKIREEVQPYVEQWYQYFAEKLPRQSEPEFDEDTWTRRGSFDRRALQRFSNLVTGRVKNPRVIRPSVKPRFIAKFVVDVSGSMSGSKLGQARKLLVFFCELLSLISKTFGYIRFSIDIFSDSITTIKGFDQEYNSSERYDFGSGENSTIKLRLMKKIQTAGGTNMLEAVQKGATDLDKEVAAYPDFMSALYLFGDGGDTCGNKEKIRDFLEATEQEQGFGDHAKNAFLIGSETERGELAGVFGDENTRVGGTLEELIEQSMEKFDDDVSFYTGRMAA